MNEKPNSATSMQGRRMAGARALWHANGMTREQKKSPPVRKVTFTQGSDSGASRTHDPQLRRLLLYPAELRNPVFCGCKDRKGFFSAKRIKLE